MNESQIKAIEQLKIKNENSIYEIDELITKIKHEYSKYDKDEMEFWDLMSEMEKSSSQIPFLPYSNAYCIVNNEFSLPSKECISDMFYGTMNKEFGFLNEQYMKDLDNKFEKLGKMLKENLSENFELISDLIEKTIVHNSITKRLSGLTNECLKLEKYKDELWYPMELSMDRYKMSGGYVVPTNVTYPQIVLPFHRQIIIKYDYLFKTKNLHIKTLKDVKTILRYINEFLPFAELIKMEAQNGINITNTLAPKQVSIGSDNDFSGEINIGSGDELEDGN